VVIFIYLFIFWGEGGCTSVAYSPVYVHQIGVCHSYLNIHTKHGVCLVYLISCPHTTSTMTLLNRVYWCGNVKSWSQYCL